MTKEAIICVNSPIKSLTYMDLITRLKHYIKIKNISIILIILNSMYNVILKSKITHIYKKLKQIKNFNKKNRKINDVNQFYIIGGIPPIPPIPPGGIGGIPLASFPDSSGPVELSAFLAAIMSSIRKIISAASPAD